MSVKDPRLSQIIPVIRCSDCGDEVVLRQLGEHICRGAPSLPVLPLSTIRHRQEMPKTTKNAGAYKPSHKPPPIPINTILSNNSTSNSSFITSPLSPGNTSSGGLMSPLRSASNPSSRPSLPFLEKYAKLSKGSTPPSAPLPQSNSDHRQDHSSTYGSNQQQYQQYQQQHAPRTPNHHYRREQNDYFPPKTPTEDRFVVAAALAASTTTAAQNQDHQPIARSYAVTRVKTPTTTTTTTTTTLGESMSTPSYSSPNSSFSSRTLQHPQPALPQKSIARTPSIASVHSLVQGNQGYEYNGRSKSSLGTHGGQSPYTASETASRDRERDRIRERANRSAPIPDYGSQYSNHVSAPTTPVPIRSGSNASSASTATERRSNRDRSNTMQSERSDIILRSEPIGSRHQETNSPSDRYGRSERKREREREREREKEQQSPLTPSSLRSGGRGFQDAASAHKIPSPPVSLRDDDDDKPVTGTTTISTKGSSYRPPTPLEIASPIPTRAARPSIGRKPSGGADQFDAMMEDLLQQIDTLPQSSSPSSRSSTRNSTRDSTRQSRSRSRSLATDGGRVPMLHMDEIAAAAPPPTPRLPNFSSNSGSSSNSSSTVLSSGGGRSDSPSTASTRSQQRRLEREKEKNEKSEREHTSSPRPRRERADSGRERERERERDIGQDRESTRDRNRARSSTATSTISTMSTSTTIRSRSAHPHAHPLRPDRTTSGSHPCQGCQYDIRPSESSRSIQMDRVGDFHAECFKCTRCRQVLDSARHAHEFEGRAYCEKDYSRMVEREKEKEKLRIQRRRLPTCAGCNSSIHSDETTVYALGQTWHDRHLHCYHCRKPIVQPSSSTSGSSSSSNSGQGQGHIEKNGRVYCSADFAELFLPKCRGCGLSIEKEAVSSQDGKLQGKWHTACFGCHTCHRPFPDKSFYVFGDAPYCRRHYHKMNGSLCKSCQEPIEGLCAQTIEGWRFHPKCFSCAECRTPLKDIYYNFENKAYCERDIAIIQRTRNVRAECRRTFFGKV